MTSHQRAAFEAAIAADRYDQTTRLVYADWLDENDLPELAVEQRRWTPEWQRADDWVRNFCKRVNLNYRYFLEQAGKCNDSNFEIDVTLNTSNATLDEDMVEMWKNVAVVLRRDVAYGIGDPFTCGSYCFPDGVDWKDEDDY